MNGKNQNPDRIRSRKNTSEISSRASKTDPEGSWTGIPENKYDEPVQDVDDL